MAHFLNNIDAYNEIEVRLGGTDAHLNDLDAVNLIAILEGAAGGHLNTLDALNAIDVVSGGAGGHLNTLDALNSIAVQNGGVGGHENDLDALNEWADLGVLDEVTGAVAAYSLRRLTVSFLGSALRVRRSGDDAEQDIGFDGRGDLDTAALELFCAATDGFVTTWYDQSGNENDATQSTASDQPQIVSAGTTIISGGNSRPAMNYSGVTDFLAMTTRLNLAAFTIFVAVQVDSDSYILNDSVVNIQIRALQEDGDISTFDGTNNPKSDDFSPNLSSLAICVYHSNGSTLSFFQSNTARGSDTYGAVDQIMNQIGQFSTGGTENLDGKLGSLIIYDSALSTANREAVGTDLDTYWV